MEDVGIFYVHFGQLSGCLTYFMDIWHIFPRFGTFLPVL
jgi:hypothetical protein